MFVYTSEATDASFIKLTIYLESLNATERPYTPPSSTHHIYASVSIPAPLLS